MPFKYYDCDEWGNVKVYADEIDIAYDLIDTIWEIHSIKNNLLNSI